MEALGLFIATYVIGILAALWRGFVAATLWGWFAVGHLGFDPISTGVAAGIVLLIGFVTNHPRASDADKDFDAEKLGKLASILVVYPLLVLLSGFIIKSFL